MKVNYKLEKQKMNILRAKVLDYLDVRTNQI